MSDHPVSSHRSIIIVGAGPAGLACALMFKAKGIHATLIGQPDSAGDTRTTALLAGSVKLLKDAGIDVTTHPGAAPLRHMAIADATRRLIRSRPVTFDSQEIGLPAFGWNIENIDLKQIMADLIAASGVEHIQARITDAKPGKDSVKLIVEGQEALTAGLVVAADGRNSLLRQSAGIETVRRDYPQIAMALNLRVSRSHRDTSTEFHTENGPFTLVPLPGMRASLVWVTSPEKADTFRTMPDDELAAAIEEQSQSLLGSVAIDSPRSFWPMANIGARCAAQNRIALIGETAHIFPPIGAQGFNLTIRDIDTLARLLTVAEDPGADKLLQAYGRARLLDTGSRRSAVDILNRSLLSGQYPLQGLRSLGMYMLEHIGPLRRAVMREGVSCTTKN